MAKTNRSPFTLVSAVLLVVAVIAVGVAAWQLARTMTAARSINEKAAVIARTGRGINIATDSIIQLNRTNEAAVLILDNVAPLDDKLATILDVAQRIDAVAGSIDTTAGRISDTAGTINEIAGEINTTAGAIDATASKINTVAADILTDARNINATAVRINRLATGINTLAAAILDVTRRLDVDVRNINLNLNTTIDIAQAIKRDTADIVAEARAARQTSACIAEKLLADSGGDCEGGPR